MLLLVLSSCRTGVEVGVNCHFLLCLDPVPTCHPHPCFEYSQSRLLANSDDWPQGFGHPQRTPFHSWRMEVYQAHSAHTLHLSFTVCLRDHAVAVFESLLSLFQLHGPLEWGCSTVFSQFSTSGHWGHPSLCSQQGHDNTNVFPCCWPRIFGISS